VSRLDKSQTSCLQKVKNGGQAIKEKKTSSLQTKKTFFLQLIYALLVPGRRVISLCQTLPYPTFGLVFCSCTISYMPKKKYRKTWDCINIATITSKKAWKISLL